MKRRRFLAAGLATAAGLPLAACSSSNGSSEPVTELTISTWTYAEQIGAWWDAILPEFEESSGIKVNLQQIAYGDYVSTITTQSIAGEGPDLIHVPTPISTLPAWADAGFLEPLDEYIADTDVADLWPEAQTAMHWGETAYGVLLVDYGYTLFYNQALLEEAGVTVPTTPEELLTAATAITELPGDQYGFAITDDNTVNFVRDALVFTAGMGSQWITDGAWSFGSDDVVAAMDVWRELGTENSPIGTDFGAKREAFLNGNSAMMIEGPFYFATVQATVSEELKDSLRIAKAPFEVNPGDVSHGMAIAADLDEGTLTAAQTFLDFVTSEEVLEQYSTIVTSPTARPDSAAALLDDPLTAPIAEAHETSVPIIDANSEGLRSNYSDFVDIVASQFHRLLKSSDPTTAILAELDTKLADGGITP